MDESLQFSEDDVRQQLDALGYHNIPTAQLRQFAQDLEGLIRKDTERNQSDEASSLISESDYSTDDLRIQVRYPQGQVAGRRPTSAPSTSRKKRQSSPQAKQGNPSDLGQADSPVTQPSTPNPFSYRYSDTSIPNLDTTDEGSPGVLRQEQRRSTEKKPTKAAMKRKVVRKLNGQVQIFDESITDSESGDLQDVNNRLSQLALRQEERYTENDDADTTLTETDDTSSLMGFIYNHGRPQLSRELYSHRPAGDEYTVFKPHLPRSFIRPDSAQPRTKHDKKTDPVSRHQMYKAEWSSHRAPGEKNRNDLRWSIREQMMYKDAVVYPRRTPKVFSANNYVVPTDKKRQALRWAVRTSLAHKQMPFPTYD